MKSKVWDTFIFFNELDLLRIRLNGLAPFVHRFVLAECTHTHAGNPKRLYFDEVKSQFSGFPITHIVLQPTARQVEAAKDNSWLLENAQRLSLATGIKDADDDDFIACSDADEIPDLENWSGLPGSFFMSLFYWKLNLLWTANLWGGTVIARKANLPNLQVMRNGRYQYPRVGGGWHYSYIGNADAIREKIKAFAHQEHNTQANLDGVEERMAARSVPFCFAPDQVAVGTIPLEGPRWLLEHAAEFAHLIEPVETR